VGEWYDEEDYRDQIEEYRHDAMIDETLEKYPPMHVDLHLQFDVLSGISIEVDVGENAIEEIGDSARPEVSKEFEKMMVEIKTWLVEKYNQYMKSRANKQPHKPKNSLARDTISPEILGEINTIIGERIQELLKEK